MRQMLKKPLFPDILFLSCFLFLFPSCQLNLKGAGGGSFNLPSVGSDYSPSDSEYFYVDLDVDTYESGDHIVPAYEISTTEEYGDSDSRDSPSNCEIEYISVDEGEDKDATETKICILDIPEWEFIVKDFHLVYNFPEGMCEYTRVGLPWHFNHEVLPGPVVQECERQTGTNDEGDPETETGFCNRISGSAVECSDDPTDLNSCVEEEENVCPGDPKCCYGGETIDGEEWEPELECFGGPALVVNGWDLPPEAFHRTIVSALPEGGLKNTISLSNLTSVNGAESFGFRASGGGASGFASTSFPYANYIEELDSSIEDLQSVSRDELLPFLQASASGFPYIPRLFFEFSCLDSAGEVLHEILFMIREWNTLEEFNEFYDSGGDDSDPDVEGSEGEDCEYEDRATLDGEFNQCNDLLDFDDMSSCNFDLYPGWCGQFASGYPGINYEPEEE